MVLHIRTKLYRYCLGTGMPDEWINNYHSPEYHSAKYGEKNQIGAFFFYLNEKTAWNVLNAAVRNAVLQGREYAQNTITSCEVTADIELLDLTGCDRPVQILNILYDNGIDILTPDFVRHYDDSKFDLIRASHLYLLNSEGVTDCKSMGKRLNEAKNIDDFFQSHIGYTGQLMTDFGNGLLFKSQLQNRGFEGYLFTEELSSPTICLFDATKLSQPIHTVV